MLTAHRQDQSMGLQHTRRVVHRTINSFLLSTRALLDENNFVPTEDDTERRQQDIYRFLVDTEIRRTRGKLLGPEVRHMIHRSAHEPFPRLKNESDDYTLLERMLLAHPYRELENRLLDIPHGEQPFDVYSDSGNSIVREHHNAITTPTLFLHVHGFLIPALQQFANIFDTLAPRYNEMHWFAVHHTMRFLLLEAVYYAAPTFHFRDDLPIVWQEPGLAQQMMDYATDEQRVLNLYAQLVTFRRTVHSGAQAEPQHLSGVDAHQEKSI